MRYFPYFIGQVIEFLISIKRLQAFLTCDTINTSIVSQSNPIEEDAISIYDGNFHWGLKIEKEENKKSD